MKPYIRRLIIKLCLWIRELNIYNNKKIYIAIEANLLKILERDRTVSYIQVSFYRCHKLKKL